MFTQLFAIRLAETMCYDVALRQPTDFDDGLALAIHDALKTHGLLATFNSADQSAVPRHLTDTTDAVWSRAAASVYLACGGARMSAAQLFAYLERIAALRFEPFGAVFAAALAQMAERDGWPATLAAATGVSVDAAAAKLGAWPEAATAPADGDEEARPTGLALLKQALDSELRYTEPGDMLTIDSTHDRTFVRAPPPQDNEE